MTQRTTLAAFRRSIPAFALALALLACSEDKSNDIETVEGNSLLLNFTRDSDTGELRWMHPDSTSLSKGSLLFGQDSKVSAGGGNIFVLSRYPGTLSCILPQNIGDESAVKQKALVEADNPYDVAVIGNKGYIALNDVDYVQVFDVNTCSPSEKIDLPISGANASTIKVSGDTLLVVLQRLDNYSYSAPGLLVRIKASTKTFIDSMQFNFYNPQYSILSNGKLYVSSQGPYNADWSIDITKAGIEVVDLATKTLSILATGNDLGGGASGIALDEANQILYASVYVDWGDSPVKPINLATKNIGNPLPDIPASSDMVFDKEGKKLFVADKDVLKIYNTVTKSTTAVNQGANALSPYSLAIVNF